MTDKVQGEIVLDHAKRELKTLGADEDMIQIFVKTIEKILEVEGYPLDRAETNSWLGDLLNLKLLSPITEDPAEWVLDDGYGTETWGNLRDPNCLSHDGGVTYYSTKDKYRIVHKSKELHND